MPVCKAASLTRTGRSSRCSLRAHHLRCTRGVRGHRVRVRVRDVRGLTHPNYITHCHVPRPRFVPGPGYRAVPRTCAPVSQPYRIQLRVPSRQSFWYNTFYVYSKSAFKLTIFKWLTRKDVINVMQFQMYFVHFFIFLFFIY